jgi:predicted transcriptional regulator
VGDYPCCSMASNVEFFKERRNELVELKKCIRDSIDEVDEDVAKEIAELINFDWKLVYRSFDSYKFVCDLNESYFRFLERYGLKLTQENIKNIADPL